jgi:hypothetical protein
MKSFSETEIKYLAGLLDADGCLFLNKYTTTNGTQYARLELSLAASESIDKHGYIHTLAERVGNVSVTVYDNGWSPSHRWRVGAIKDLHQLLPRITKYMVIKGAHWKRLYDFYCENSGVDISDVDVREWSEESRLQAGPIKTKIHPTWAWTAGYLDGDGHYSFKKRIDTKGTSYILRVGAVAHKNDRVGLDLLFKAFGGVLSEDGDCIRWQRNLGVRDRSFAQRFLTKVVRHSHLKKWKIEQMLAFHN